MLLIVCLAFGATALTVTLRWGVARVDAVGRVRAFPMFAVAVPAAAAVLCTVPLLRHARLEARLEEVAGRLAGREVDVRCETVDQAWLQAHPERGYVEFGPDGVPLAETVITYDTCRALADWVGSDHTSVTDEQVVAVHVLTHEAMHMSGLTDEARTECAALQRDRLTATLLGADDAVARELAGRYLTAVYPAMPDEYRNTECRLGGALDEHLETSPWT